MVVFTCNLCGDSVQKPKVEKHITFECKKKFMNPSLCCVDCLKDFNRVTYNEHTKCVTEQERYSGKGFVPKPSSNKGEKKQQSWIEIIQLVLQKSNLTRLQRDVLNELSKFPNVPRKQQKFMNFIKSIRCVKMNYTLADEIFKLLDEEWKSSANVNDNKAPQNNSDETKLLSSIDLSEPVKEDIVEQKIKKEKKKKQDICDEKRNEIPLESSENPFQHEEAIKNHIPDVTAEKIKKKKKKNKTRETENQEISVELKHEEFNETNNENKDIDNNVTQSNENGLVDSQKDLDKTVSFEVVKKKKKSKRKDNEDKAHNQNNQIAEINENEKRLIDNDFDIPPKNVSKKKQKKLKLRELPENLPVDVSATEDQNSTVPELSNIEKSPENVVSNVIENVENLTKKEKKEAKKRLKYEAQLQTINAESKQSLDNEMKNNHENDNSVPKSEKKKKRKLTESNNNEEIMSKKIKISEPEPLNEQLEMIKKDKFSWEETIRAVLLKANGHEISLKKLSKKVVAEFMWYHANEKSYDDVAKKFNKKIMKLPYVKVCNEKAKLCA